MASIRFDNGDGYGGGYGGGFALPRASDPETVTKDAGTDPGWATLPGAGGYQPTDPARTAAAPAYTPPAATPAYGAQDPRTSIAGYYQNFLGRPGSTQEVNQWGTNIDAGYLNKIAAAISGSAEAKAFAARGAAPTAAATTQTASAAPGGMSATDFVRQWQQTHPAHEGIGPLADAMRQAGYTNVSRFMYGSQPSNNELMIDGQKFKVLGNEDGPNPYWYTGGNDSAPGGFGGGGMGYTDASANIYLGELANRMNQLRAPVHDPFEDLLKLFALTRVQGLSGNPYTAGDDAALTAHYMNPLTQARDAALQRNKERIGARGMAPTSGLLDSLNRDTEAGYEQAVGQGANNLGVQAVNEKQRRADEQLAILGNLLSVNRSGVDRQNANYDQIVQLARMFPDFDAQRLNMLLSAGGNGSDANSAMSALTSLGGLNLNGMRLGQDQANTSNANSQASAAAWGQILGAILGAL
jgi:hypothetical protein